MNEFQKFVVLKFEFFNFNTFDVPWVFKTASCTSEAKTQQLCFLVEIVLGFCLLGNTLRSMPRIFPGFYFVSHCAIYIWYHMLCYLPIIYNYLVGKLFGRVLIKRVMAGTECAIGEEQCGFRQGRECMD